jgi:hypothetical protein
MTIRERLHRKIDTLPEAELKRLAAQLDVLDPAEPPSQTSSQDFKAFLQAMPEGVGDVVRDPTPARVVDL